MEIKSVKEAKDVAVELIKLIASIKGLDDLPHPVARAYLKDCLSKISAIGDFLAEDDWDAVIGGPEQNRKEQFGLTLQAAEDSVDIIVEAERVIEEVLRSLDQTDCPDWGWPRIRLHIEAPFDDLSLMLSEAMVDK